jgi:hypothetical protein
VSTSSSATSASPLSRASPDQQREFKFAQVDAFATMRQNDSTFGKIHPPTRAFAMCAWEGAPFRLHWDAFSCSDALDFNSSIREIPNNGGLFENPVNVQGKSFPVYVLYSPLPRQVTPRSVRKH